MHVTLAYCGYVDRVGFWCNCYHSGQLLRIIWVSAPPIERMTSSEVHVGLWIFSAIAAPRLAIPAAVIKRKEKRLTPLVVWPMLKLPRCLDGLMSKEAADPFVSR